jgi:hypothetical protein
LLSVKLTRSEAELVQRPIRGIGGMQSLLRGLQKKLDEETLTLELTNDDVEKILRYAKEYGEGGFQGRLGGMANAIKRARGQPA